MFSPTGPRPWYTKPSSSKFDALVNEALEKHYTIEDILNGKLNRQAAAEMAETREEAVSKEV